MSSMIGNSGMRPTSSSLKKVKGTGHKLLTLENQNYTPEQMNLFRNLFSHVQPESYLSKLAGGDEGAFEQLEAPAKRLFGQFQGQNATRFSEFAPEAMSALKGSGFRNYQTQAASTFAQDLASKRLDYQRQALKDLLGISESLLDQRPFTQENLLIQPRQKQSTLQKILGIGAPIAGATAGGAFGGPAGAAIGGQLGSSFASGLTGNPSQGNYSGISSLPSQWR